MSSSFDAASLAGSTVTLSPTTSSTSSAITFPSGGSCIAQVANDGPDGAYVVGGVGSATATSSHFYIGVGITRDLLFGNGTTYVAAICPSSSATVHITPICKG